MLRNELRYHGEYGVEAQFYQDGEFLSGRRFDLKARAQRWAEVERGELEKQGWRLMRQSETGSSNQSSHVDS